jgi:hypothetical protein
VLVESTLSNHLGNVKRRGTGMQAELGKKRPSPSRVTHKYKHSQEKEVSDLTERMKRTDMGWGGGVVSSHWHDSAFHCNVIM